MNKKISVMLVEDHPEYREVIDLALKDEPDIELTSKVGSSERAMRVLQDHSRLAMPDLILLDLNLPGKSGLETLPAFRSAYPEIHVIVLTQSNDEADVMHAIRLGASGYLLKSSTVDQIVDAIRTVAAGGALLGSGIAKFILSSLQNRLPDQELVDALSQREMEILVLLGEGQMKKEIARELDISIATVATYIRRIYEKLDVQNAPAAIAKAYRTGVFPLDDKPASRSERNH